MRGKTNKFLGILLALAMLLTSVLPSMSALAAGAAVYTRVCAMCHGPAGEGTAMGVALTTPHTAAQVKEKVTKGPINPGDKMPPLAAAISAEELDAVSAYVAAGLKQ